MNFFLIVKNEFSNLLSNKYVYVTLFFFLINIVIYIFDINDSYSGDLESWRIVSGSLVDLSNMLSLYGGVVALLVGFSSMTDEFSGRALNTLIVKPVHRDTILNAKLVGCMCFLLCIFCLTTAIYIAILAVLFGGAIVPALPEIFIRLPLILFFTLLYPMVLFSIAILLRILIPDNTAALLAIVVAYLFITVLMPNAVFTAQVGTLIGLNDQDALSWIASLTPWWTSVQVISGGLFSFNASLTQIINSCWLEFAKLSLLIIILTTFSYILFMRRDIQ